jgi:hypothetical protein
MCNEAEARDRRAYGPSGLDAFRVGNVSHNHFGLVLVSCERADLRPTPRGVWIYADDGRQLDELPGPSFLEPKSWMSCAMPSCSNARATFGRMGSCDAGMLPRHSCVRLDPTRRRATTPGETKAKSVTSELVNSLKGVSSCRMKHEFPAISTFWSVRKSKGHLWSPSYSRGPWAERQSRFSAST